MHDERSFGRWIRQRRAALDLTQESLAERVGCAIQTIRKIERGERRPSRQIAERLAEVLELEPGERAAFLQAARPTQQPGPLLGDARASSAVDGGVPAVAPGGEAPRPDPGALPAGTVTFLFTDIEGSTRLWERHADAMPRALARHNALVRQAVERHGGVVFRTIGDAFCAAFAVAPDALAAAHATQHALQAEPWGATGPLRVRMALHTGTVDLRGGDYFGAPLTRLTRLLSSGHGGQVLLSRATHNLVVDRLPSGASLRDLGTYRLKDLSRPEQIFQLVAPDLPGDFPPLVVGDTLASHLPVPAIPFIGREAELAELARLLADPACRLLTLVGPGGAGKTRLAIQAAADHVERFAHGVHFVSLAPVSSPALIGSAIADALDFAFYGPGDPLAQLLGYLQEKELLLVLDNMEHLLDGIEVLAEILERAPRVKLLVTSQERLKLRGEWVVELAGLLVPKAGSAKQIERFGAVALFLQRARQVQGGFALSEADQAAVVRICRLVEGMPLGIELAAAWVRVLSCGEIAQEIERSLDFLAASARDLPERHRSLRAVFDYSWRLLSAPERAALRRLAVFRGGFARAAAEQVAEAGLPLLAALVDKSLLRRAAAGRYDMHELVRQYATTQLQADPQEDQAARELHCGYYAGLLAQREWQLRGRDQQAALAELGMEVDNLRLAWQWAVAHGKTAMIRQMARSLSWFYELRGWALEGAVAFERAVAVLRPAGGTDRAPGAERIDALGLVLSHQGYFSFRQGRFAQAQDLLQESMVLLRQAGDQAGLADTLSYLAIASHMMGDYARSHAFAEESYRIGKAIDYRWNIAFCLSAFGMIGHAQGSYREAYDRLHESLAVWRAVGDHRGLGFCLSYLGTVALVLGEYAEAQAVLREGLAVSSAIGDRWGIATALNHLGLVAHAQHEDAEAQYLFRESVALFRAIGDRWSMARALNHLGGTLGALDARADARHAFLEALRTAVEAQIMPVALDALVGLAALLAREGAAVEAMVLLAHGIDHPASSQETRTRVGQLRAGLERDLTPDQLLAVREHVRARPFDAVVAALLG